MKHTNYYGDALYLGKDSGEFSESYNKMYFFKDISKFVQEDLYYINNVTDLLASYSNELLGSVESGIFIDKYFDIPKKKRLLNKTNNALEFSGLNNGTISWVAMSYYIENILKLSATYSYLLDHEKSYQYTMNTTADGVDTNTFSLTSIKFKPSYSETYFTESDEYFSTQDKDVLEIGVIATMTDGYRLEVSGLTLDTMVNHQYLITAPLDGERLGLMIYISDTNVLRVGATDQGFRDIYTLENGVKYDILITGYGYTDSNPTAVNFAVEIYKRGEQHILFTDSVGNSQDLEKFFLFHNLDVTTDEKNYVTDMSIVIRDKSAAELRREL